MRVLIVHYHLKPGGVSSVIRRQASALKGLGYEARVLVGEAPGVRADAAAYADIGFPLVIESALAYDQAGQVPNPDDPRIAAIVAAVQSCIGPPSEDVVVHVHNPTIRKNSACLPALSVLAAKGYALVLHVHDLAEDWRPDVYCQGEYPRPATWVCINQRDVSNLKAAGATQVYFLPNAVFSEEAKTGLETGTGPETGTDSEAGAGSAAGTVAAEAGHRQPDQSGDLILYPVRGIRRKNLGEALLLSLYLPVGLAIGITLPPNNPRDFPYYQGWKAAAAVFGAPISFELGLNTDFNELYRQARAVVSTSVKEGFGLSFLEPLSRAKAVLGRRLPWVVDDFEEWGLNFPGLYQNLCAPEEFFNSETLLQRVQQAVTASAGTYGFEGKALAASIGESLKGTPDFGRLDETAQAEVLSRIVADTGAKAAFLACNPILANWWESQGEPVSFAKLSPWSEASYGKRLANLYQSVRDTGGGSPPNKAILLELYLNSEGFYGVGI